MKFQRKYNHFCFRSITFPSIFFFSSSWFCSDVIADRDIQSAVYLSRGPRYLPKFGDIITLASGRLDKGEFGEMVISETEENCVKRCNEDATLNENSTATWMVEKIRHRDVARGHRYEFRISVVPVKKPNQGSKRDAKSYVTDEKPKSFLLKDEDYPRYFELLDTFDPEQPVERADRRLFDTRYDRMLIPFQLNYNKPHRNVVYSKHSDSVHGLNIGEYFARPEFFTSPQATQKVFHDVDFNYPPTAFRDTIPIGTGPETLSYLPKTSTNLHRHIYLNKNGAPLFTASAYEQQSTINPHTNTGAVIFPTSPEAPRPTISKNTGFNSLARYKGQYVVPTEDNRATVSTVPPQLTAPGKLNQILNFPYELNSHIAAGQNYQYQLEHTFGTAPDTFYGNTILSGPTKLPNSVSAPQFSGTKSANSQFRANYIYQPQGFSDPDPLYHSPIGPLLVTPVNYPSSSDISLNIADVVSQLPPTRPAEVQSTKPITEQPVQDDDRSPPAATSQSRTPPVLLITPRRKYPDSINAQLPPGDENTDFNVPYVDASVPVVTEKEYNVNIIGTVDDELHTQQSIQVTTEAQITKQPEPVNNEPETQTKKPMPPTNAPKKAIIRLRNRIRENSTTTEKPVLKWVPKRSHISKVTKSSIENSSSREQRDSTTPSSSISESSESSSQEDLIIVTPVNAQKPTEASTKLSVSKSVSVRVSPKRLVVSKAKQDDAKTTTDVPSPTRSEKTFLPTPAPDAVGNATQPYIYFNETQSSNPQPDERVVAKLAKAIKKRQRKIS